MPAQHRDADPPLTIGARLTASRAERFVGRDAEVGLFEQALTDAEPPFAVLFVHGPPGVGKSTLLRRFRELADGAGRRTTLVDMRNATLTPDGLRATITDTTGGSYPDVLLIDTYELGQALDGWLREHLLPSLPAGTVVVIAGRFEPGAGWTTDPGWRTLTRVVALRNLDREDARRLLAIENIEPQRGERMLDETFGHPLALSVYVDLEHQRASATDEDGAAGMLEAPNVVRSLLDRFVDEVPSARHREALELCAHVRFTTEDLVRAGLDVDDETASELFDWLRRLSFVDDGRDGSFPHDLARDILDSDLRWRDPAAYARLHRRVRAHLVEKVRSSQGERRTSATVDVVFLHRSNPAMRPFWDFSSIDQGYTDRLRQEDRQALREMVEAHEGADSAAVLLHWLDRQPQAFAVFRQGASPDPRGFTALLALEKASAEDLARDPAAHAMWSHVQRTGGAPPGQSVVACRWVMDRETHQAPGSLGFGLTSVQHLRHMLSHGERVLDFIGGVARPEELDPVFTYIDFIRSPALEYDLGGRRWHTYVMDWRRRDVDAWFATVADRELGAPVEPTLLDEPDATIALSHSDFADAVRAVLKDIDRPERLRHNPLLRSRLIQGRIGDGVDGLAAVVRDAVDELAIDDRTRKYHRALDRTFLRPAATQERAAEVLDLPFSTYRRHLTRGVGAVVSSLWDRELYGSDSKVSNEWSGE